jgi:hypothetical protein
MQEQAEPTMSRASGVEWLAPWGVTGLQGSPDGFTLASVRVGADTGSAAEFLHLFPRAARQLRAGHTLKNLLWLAAVPLRWICEVRQDEFSLYG